VRQQTDAAHIALYLSGCLPTQPQLRKLTMTDHKMSSLDKVETLRAELSDTVQDLMHEAKPMMDRAAHRATKRVSDLAHEGMEAACHGKHLLEHEARDASEQAMHLIRREPFKAMLIAAGVGAAAVAVVGLMTRSRAH
jgi:ElaB/YqjD/DUF883 family membrane-anchored ribosome-binding protein